MIVGGRFNRIVRARLTARHKAASLPTFPLSFPNKGSRRHKQNGPHPHSGRQPSPSPGRFRESRPPAPISRVLFLITARAEHPSHR